MEREDKVLKLPNKSLTNTSNVLVTDPECDLVVA